MMVCTHLYLLYFISQSGIEIPAFAVITFPFGVLSIKQIFNISKNSQTVPGFRLDVYIKHGKCFLIDIYNAECSIIIKWIQSFTCIFISQVERYFWAQLISSVKSESVFRPA